MVSRQALLITSVVTLALLPQAGVHSYAPTIASSESRYATYPVPGGPARGHLFVGELMGFPDTYEFTLLEPQELAITVRQLRGADPIPFAVLTVAEEPGGGVREVLRHRPSNDAWETSYDALLGLGFYRSTPPPATLSPGVYRIEVSAPENSGAYLLTLGEGPPAAGYVSGLANIRAVHQVLNVPLVTMLRSTYVLSPVAVLAVLSVALFIWWRRRRHMYAQ